MAWRTMLLFWFDGELDGNHMESGATKSVGGTAVPDCIVPSTLAISLCVCVSSISTASHLAQTNNIQNTFYSRNSSLSSISGLISFRPLPRSIKARKIKEKFKLEKRRKWLCTITRWHRYCWTIDDHLCRWRHLWSTAPLHWRSNAQFWLTNRNAQLLPFGHCLQTDEMNQSLQIS